MHVTHNQITHNAHWAIFEDAVIVGHGLTESQNNLYEANNFEENGSAGSSFGAIYLTRSRGDIITANYFEKSPRQVVLGIPGAGNGYRAYGVVVRDNFFTTLTTTPFNIEIENADSAMVEGNSELVATIGANNCFVNIVGRDAHLDFEECDLPEELILHQRSPGSASPWGWLLLLWCALGLPNDSAIFDDRYVALRQLLPPAANSFCPALKKPPAKIFPTYFGEYLVLIPLVLADGAEKKPQEVASPLYRRRVQIDVGTLGRQKIAVAVGSHFFIEVEGGDGVLQLQIAGYIGASPFLVHRLESVHVGKIEPELFTVSADLGQGGDPHQGCTVHGIRLLRIHTMECAGDLFVPG